MKDQDRSTIYFLAIAAPFKDDSFYGANSRSGKIKDDRSLFLLRGLRNLNRLRRTIDPFEGIVDLTVIRLQVTVLGLDGFQKTLNGILIVDRVKGFDGFGECGGVVHV